MARIPWLREPADAMLRRMSLQQNPWKISTFALLGALVVTVGRGATTNEAEAAGPVRLSKALGALKASKKFLDEAKDPPAPYHQQSVAIVHQAIAAVEREIKAHEDKVAREKAKVERDKKREPTKKDPPKKDKAKDPRPTGVDD